MSMLPQKGSPCSPGAKLTRPHSDPDEEVNESGGEVVEALPHPINENHGRVGSGGGSLARGTLASYFFYKAHTDLTSCLTGECKCRLTEEDVDTKP
jgi:hypothetical protein